VFVCLSYVRSVYNRQRVWGASCLNVCLRLTPINAHRLRKSYSLSHRRGAEKYKWDARREQLAEAVN
jgi:hypothetical protein